MRTVHGSTPFSKLDPTVTTSHVWRPKVTIEDEPRDSSQLRVSSTEPSQTFAASPSVKVSLEHTPMQPPSVPGFNSSPHPYQPPPELNNNQPSHKPVNFPYVNRAEQYLLEKGGLFGTDPAVMKAREQPSYLQSETLKLIQEQEKNGRPRAKVPNSPDAVTSREPIGSHKLPQCFLCGRSIIGVMCRVQESVAVHPECFQCSTCGTSLRNVGHHFLNEKFYCDVHGQQRMQLGGGRAPRPGGISSAPLNPDLVVKIPPSAAQPTRVPEPPRGFYQPKILTTGPLSPSQPPQRSPIDNIARTTVYNNQVYAPESSNASNGNAYQQQQQQQKTTIYEQQRLSSTSSSLPPPISTGDTQHASATSNAFTDGIRQHGQLVNQTNRVPFCEQCKAQIRGAYVLAAGMTWCPEHFVCANPACNRRLLDTGFVEEKGKKYCEKCFETLIAPICNKCGMPITADCLTALQRRWHPECFVCHHCSRPFGNSAFYLENGRPYCEQDWNMLFTTKCVSCKFPIEAGDRWVEAIGSAFHSNCFCCTICQTNLEGQSFYAKNGLPFCRIHA